MAYNILPQCRGLLVGVRDEYSAWNQLGFHALAPLQNLLWPHGSPLIGVGEIDLQFAVSHGGDDRSSTGPSVPALWYLKPFLHIYVVVCEDLGTFKASIRQQIQRWLENVQKDTQVTPHWVIIYVSATHSLSAQRTGSVADKAAKARARSNDKIFETLKNDFNGSKGGGVAAEHCFRLHIGADAAAAAAEAGTGGGVGNALQTAVVRGLKNEIVASVTERHRLYSKEVAQEERAIQLCLFTLPPQSTDRSRLVAHLCRSVLAREGLAHLLLSLGLRDQAITEQYEFMAAFLDQTPGIFRALPASPQSPLDASRTGIATAAAPNYFVSHCSSLKTESDQVLQLLGSGLFQHWDIDGKIRKQVMEYTVSELLLRVYLSMRQAQCRVAPLPLPVNSESGGSSNVWLAAAFHHNSRPYLIVTRAAVQEAIQCCEAFIRRMSDHLREREAAGVNDLVSDGCRQRFLYALAIHTAEASNSWGRHSASPRHGGSIPQSPPKTTHIVSATIVQSPREGGSRSTFTTEGSNTGSPGMSASPVSVWGGTPTGGSTSPSNDSKPPEDSTEGADGEHSARGDLYLLARSFLESLFDASGVVTPFVWAALSNSEDVSGRDKVDQSSAILRFVRGAINHSVDGGNLTTSPSVPNDSTSTDSVAAAGALSSNATRDYGTLIFNHLYPLAAAAIPPTAAAAAINTNSTCQEDATNTGIDVNAVIFDEDNGGGAMNASALSSPSPPMAPIFANSPVPGYSDGVLLTALEATLRLSNAMPAMDACRDSPETELPPHTAQTSSFPSATVAGATAISQCRQIANAWIVLYGDASVKAMIQYRLAVFRARTYNCLKSDVAALLAYSSLFTAAEHLARGVCRFFLEERWMPLFYVNRHLLSQCELQLSSAVNYLMSALILLAPSFPLSQDQKRIILNRLVTLTSNGGAFPASTRVMLPPSLLPLNELLNSNVSPGLMRISVRLSRSTTSCQVQAGAKVDFDVVIHSYLCQPITVGSVSLSLDQWLLDSTEDHLAIDGAASPGGSTGLSRQSVKCSSAEEHPSGVVISPGANTVTLKTAPIWECGRYRAGEVWLKLGKHMSLWWHSDDEEREREEQEMSVIVQAADHVQEQNQPPPELKTRVVSSGHKWKDFSKKTNVPAGVPHTSAQEANDASGDNTESRGSEDYVSVVNNSSGSGIKVEINSPACFFASSCSYNTSVVPCLLPLPFDVVAAGQSIEVVLCTLEAPVASIALQVLPSPSPAPMAQALLPQATRDRVINAMKTKVRSESDKAALAATGEWVFQASVMLSPARVESDNDNVAAVGASQSDFPKPGLEQVTPVKLTPKIVRSRSNNISQPYAASKVKTTPFSFQKRMAQWVTPTKVGSQLNRGSLPSAPQPELLLAFKAVEWEADAAAARVTVRNVPPHTAVKVTVPISAATVVLSSAAMTSRTHSGAERSGFSPTGTGVGIIQLALIHERQPGPLDCVGVTLSGTDSPITSKAASKTPPSARRFIRVPLPLYQPFDVQVNSASSVRIGNTALIQVTVKCTSPVPVKVLWGGLNTTACTSWCYVPLNSMSAGSPPVSESKLCRLLPPSDGQSFHPRLDNVNFQPGDSFSLVLALSMRGPLPPEEELSADPNSDRRQHKTFVAVPELLLSCIALRGCLTNAVEPLAGIGNGSANEQLHTGQRAMLWKGVDLCQHGAECHPIPFYWPLPVSCFYKPAQYAVSLRCNATCRVGQPVELTVAIQQMQNGCLPLPKGCAELQQVFCDIVADLNLWLVCGQTRQYVGKKTLKTVEEVCLRYQLLPLVGGKLSCPEVKIGPCLPQHIVRSPGCAEYIECLN